MYGTPQRHDSTYHFTINTEIRVFDRKFLKITEHFEHILRLKCNSQLTLYTRHSLHLNAVGKEAISKQIASLICKSIGNEKEPPVSLKWKAVRTECTVTTVLNTLSKQQISNWSVDSQVHNGTIDGISDHIGAV
jgi:hypothetical protein